MFKLLDSKVKGFVKCEKCGKEHPVEGREYFVVYGNIMVGKDGGIIGNNFNEGELKSVSVFCLECLIEFLEDVKRDV